MNLMGYTPVLYPHSFSEQGRRSCSSFVDTEHASDIVCHDPNGFATVRGSNWRQMFLIPLSSNMLIRRSVSLCDHQPWVVNSVLCKLWTCAKAQERIQCCPADEQCAPSWVWFLLVLYLHIAQCTLQNYFACGWKESAHGWKRCGGTLLVRVLRCTP